MEVTPGGGSVRPEPDARASVAIFVVEGEGTITYDGNDYPIRAGSFVYLPAAAKWAFSNESAAPIRFPWVRKVFKVVDGLELPPAIFIHKDDCIKHAMPDILRLRSPKLLRRHHFSLREMVANLDKNRSKMACLGDLDSHLISKA
ncbi:hypothetical protein ATO67_20425 [Agrobacterium bohemicum]|uniref:Cupin type-2 domain-containing protein n=1 Tax=Agrobacterium bohemicum TaxID=2052828 RepID=A0A135P6R8_9HYPH|nr:hypothetical protein ATO67_20425 [Agrobacterium bohemicum]